MRQDFAIRWIESAPDLFEARLTTPEGKDVYVGYIAVTPGAAVWRGYVGRSFEPVGMGSRAAMQEAVERRALEALGRHKWERVTERMPG
jgi:hypothetical protein